MAYCTHCLNVEYVQRSHIVRNININSMTVFKVILSSLITISLATQPSKEDLEKIIYNEYERKESALTTAVTFAEWNSETNITDENSDRIVNVTLYKAIADKQFYDDVIANINLNEIQDAKLKRILTDLKCIGTAALNTTEVKTLTDSVNKMVEIYGTAKICPYKKQICNLETEGLALEPDIEELFATSKSYDELLYAWKGWRDATGKKMRKLYKTYVNISNEASKLNGFSDLGAFWRSDFEDENFIKNLGKMWEMVKPLYTQLHFYVRRKLIKIYGKDKFNGSNTIPAHLLGNIWAQTWTNLEDVLKPFPNETMVNVTDNLIKQGYTPLKMFEKANEFYISLGLLNNSVSYGPGSMITKPKDREVVCHASAFDFYDRKTFRIKMCTKVNQDDFITIHHEMGHIQYFLQYKDQPITFRDGANPGFHEAIGDTIALSVSSIKHLTKIGLINNFNETENSSINALMWIALEKVAFLPFGYLIDKWRWDVFSGTIPEEEWNKKWWEYREFYQKVSPPTSRSEDDFDPGSKYHVAADSQYISYFVSYILQFQLYRSFCILAGEYDPVTRTPPLHNCDFYQNKEVGKKLSSGLSLGKSVHWKIVLEEMTGEKDLDPTALLEYFEPLYKFLHEHNLGSSSNKCKSLLPLIMSILCLYYFIR